MYYFLKRFLFFTSLLMAFILGCICLPTTPRASGSLMFAEIDKKKLLADTSINNRVIFIGGSNLSFGLNSQILKDSLDLNPINTAIHASIGLAFMLDNYLPFIKSGDLVIVAPEYEHFYNNYAYGDEALVRLLLDVEPNKIKILGPKQVFRNLSYVPKYAIKKLLPSEYNTSGLDGIYSRNAYNKYGDAVAHWNMPSVPFSPFSLKGKTLDEAILKKLKSFDQKVADKGAKLYLTFPCIEPTSFENSKSEINTIYTEYRKNGFDMLGTPQRYMLPIELFFNTPYHLTKKGMDIRSILLIEDIRNSTKNQSNSLKI